MSWEDEIFNSSDYVKVVQKVNRFIYSPLNSPLDAYKAFRYVLSQTEIDDFMGISYSRDLYKAYLNHYAKFQNLYSVFISMYPDYVQTYPSTNADNKINPVPEQGRDSRLSAVQKLAGVSSESVSDSLIKYGAVTIDSPLGFMANSLGGVGSVPLNVASAVKITRTDSGIKTELIEQAKVLGDRVKISPLKWFLAGLIAIVIVLFIRRRK